MMAMTRIAAVIALKAIPPIRITFLGCCRFSVSFQEGEPCACDHDPACVVVCRQVTGSITVSRVSLLFRMRVYLVNRSQKGRAVCRRCRAKMSAASMIPRRGRIEEGVYIDACSGCGRFCGIPDWKTNCRERFRSAGVMPDSLRPPARPRESLYPSGPPVLRPYSLLLFRSGLRRGRWLSSIPIKEKIDFSMLLP